jgi:hypothetical protein
MNMSVQQPSLSSMLSQVATIVKVGKTSLGLKRQDKRASKESDRNHNAEEGTSVSSVNRFKGRGAERVKEINDVGNELIEMVKDRTTDWGGQRLANNVVLQEILGIVQQKKATYQHLVDALVIDAPELIREAQHKIGSYDVEPPTEQEIRESFSITFEVSQIADSDSFRASNLDPVLEAEMKRRLEASVQAAYTNATQDALKRVAEPVGNLVKRMTEYSKQQDEKARGVTSSGGRLYDSTIGNVQEIGRVFRSFNLTNDPLMGKIADQLDQFAAIDTEDLKTSQALRDDVSQKAAAILDSLKDLI